MALVKKVSKLRDAEGAGDLVAWLTGKMGIETDEDCGCEERRKALNERFPFKKLREQQQKAAR